MMRIEQLPVRGTNCYLLQGTAGVVLIDPGPPGSAPAIIDKMAGLGIPPEQVRLILVTHGHLDHYGGVPAIKAWCGAPVVAHPIAPGFSQDRRNALPPAQTLQGSLMRWVYLLLSPLARFAPLHADLLLDEGAGLSPYGLDAQLIAVPGHAPLSCKKNNLPLIFFNPLNKCVFTVPSEHCSMWLTCLVESPSRCLRMTTARCSVGSSCNARSICARRSDSSAWLSCETRLGVAASMTSTVRAALRLCCFT